LVGSNNELSGSISRSVESMSDFFCETSIFE